MLSHTEMKSLLKEKRESTRYFTKDFYSTFISDYREAVNDCIKGIDREAYVKTKQTDFYNRNSCAYCVFLEIFNSKANLQKFTIIYSVDEWGNGTRRIERYAENMEIMKLLAKAWMEQPVSYVEVKVA
jgi:predicted transcriptional regulator